MFDAILAALEQDGPGTWEVQVGVWTPGGNQHKTAILSGSVTEVADSAAALLNDVVAGRHDDPS